MTAKSIPIMVGNLPLPATADTLAHYVGWIRHPPVVGAQREQLLAEVRKASVAAGHKATLSVLRYLRIAGFLSASNDALRCALELLGE